MVLSKLVANSKPLCCVAVVCVCACVRYFASDRRVAIPAFNFIICKILLQILSLSLIMASSTATLFQQAVANKAVKWIGLGWLGFISENVIISENREVCTLHSKQLSQGASCTPVKTPVFVDLLY